MSISNETVRSLSTANGVTTAFAIPHTIVSSDSSEVEVYLVDESADPITETLQVEGALQDYTLTGASPPTTPFDTHVTFNTAPTNGLKVLIQRKIALTQPTDLDENGPFPAEEVETSLDRLAAEIQLLNLKVSRALKTRQSAPTANLDPSLPEPESGKLMRWNSAEDGLENVTLADIGESIVFPGSSTDNAIPRWSGTGGTELQNSGVTIDDSNNMTGVASVEVTNNIRNTQLTASRAVVTDGDKDLASATTTATEIGYVNGVTSSIQTQLDSKIAQPAVPTIQRFTSGSGTYTTPANVKWIRVRMVGAGGGGGGSGNTYSSTAGTTGGNTTFGTSLLIANGGAGGQTFGAGGAGGTVTVNAPAIATVALQGGRGQPAWIGTAGGGGSGGNGGVSPFGGAGGGGTNDSGHAAIVNSGSGGGGGGGPNTTPTYSGTGGGAGGYIDAIISAPSSSYSYAVGASGAGAAGFGGGHAGNASGSGIIIVEEYYI